jgi:autotransporter-associated beta strand protein
VKALGITLFAAAFASTAGSIISPGRASVNEICFEGETYQLGESRVFMGREQDDPYAGYGGVPFNPYLGVSGNDGALDAAATDLAINEWFSSNAAASWGKEDIAQRFAVALAGEYPSKYNFKKIAYSHDAGSAGRLNWWDPNGQGAVSGFTENYKGDTYVTSISLGICTIGGPGEERLLKSVEDGHVLPIFTGGTLLVDRNGETNQNFEVQDVDGNTIDNAGHSLHFSGNFEGDGGLRFKGGGETTLSGVNTYKGATEVVQGDLVAASFSAIPRYSRVEIGGSGHLDLASVPSGLRGEFQIDNIGLTGDGAQLSVSALNPLRVGSLAFRGGEL